MPPPEIEESVGAFICSSCAESHRQLGPDVCHVRSVGMEECEWVGVIYMHVHAEDVAVAVLTVCGDIYRTLTIPFVSPLFSSLLLFGITMTCRDSLWICVPTGHQDDVAAMERGGNKKVNSAWEAKLTFDTPRPNAIADRQERDAFVQQKYVERYWYSESIMKKQNASASFGNFALKASSSDTKSRSSRRLNASAATAPDEDYQYEDAGPDYMVPLDNSGNAGGSRTSRMGARRPSARNLAEDGHADPHHPPTGRRQGRRQSITNSGSSRNLGDPQDHHHQSHKTPSGRPALPRQRSTRRASIAGGAMPSRGVGRAASGRSAVRELADAAAAAARGDGSEASAPTPSVAARRLAARRSSMSGSTPMDAAASNPYGYDDAATATSPTNAAGEPRRRRAPRRSSVSGTAPYADVPADAATSSRSLISSDEEMDEHVQPSSSSSIRSSQGPPRPGRRGQRVRGNGVSRTYSSQSCNSDDDNNTHHSDDRSTATGTKSRRGTLQRTRSSRTRDRPRSSRQLDDGSSNNNTEENVGRQHQPPRRTSSSRRLVTANNTAATPSKHDSDGTAITLTDESDHSNTNNENAKNGLTLADLYGNGGPSIPQGSLIKSTSTRRMRSGRRASLC